MTFNKFTPENCALGTRKKQSAAMRSPYCRVSQKGNILLSTGAADLLALKEGDRIAFEQDTQYPSDWYISRDPQGFQTQAVSNRGPQKGFLRVASYQLAARILGTLDGFGSDRNCATYPVKVAGGKLALCSNGARTFQTGGGQRKKLTVLTIKR